ncbi:hypothetical protein O0H59_10365 [Staphylococcus pseudintermedius]|nr:hypothetical protein [Staphylococcus pseudintermedius]
MAQIPNPNDIVSETIQRAQQQQPEAIEKLVTILSVSREKVLVILV